MFVFLVVDAFRVFKKTVSKIYEGNIQKVQSMSVDELSALAKSRIKKGNSVVFLSDDGLAYMYFNLLSYPLVAKWSTDYTAVELRDWDYLVVYDTVNMFQLRSGLYSKNDFN